MTTNKKSANHNFIRRYHRK